MKASEQMTQTRQAACKVAGLLAEHDSFADASAVELLVWMQATRPLLDRTVARIEAERWRNNPFRKEPHKALVEQMQGGRKAKGARKSATPRRR
jgi:hypothetical protein